MSLAGRTFQGHRVPGWLASLALLGSYAAIAAPGRAAPAGTKRARRTRQGRAAWKPVLFRTCEEINNDRLLALAAGVVFYGLLALFPAITALASSYALFANSSTINGHLALIAGLMPASAVLVGVELNSEIDAERMPGAGQTSAF
jgi:hypothetical protein